MCPSAPPTDGELLRRAADRDAAAFSTIYVRYEAIVAGYLVRRPRDPELAADLTVPVRDDVYRYTTTESPAFMGVTWFDAQGKRLDHRRR